MRTFDLRRRAVPIGLAVSGWLVLGITALAGHNLVRPLAVFAFALFGPGLAVVRLLRIRDLLERLVLALAIGLSMAALAAEATAIDHVMQPARVLAVLAVICSGAALIELTGEAGKS
jgi:hypothetical protein